MAGTTLDVGLLERCAQIAALNEARLSASDGQGVLVLLGGEAGSGKTTLVRRFCAQFEPPAAVAWGACDPLFTPRPLGPFADIAYALGGTLRDLVDAGAKTYQLAAEIMRQATSRPGMIVVLEDLHWADEATLDIVTLLGRRMASLPALIIATYRDDEIGRAHPLRGVLGELRAAASIQRLTTDRLSLPAVAMLAAPYDIDAELLHRITAGNAFFVTEVLAAAGQGDIPPTVRDAVMTRVARLGSPATEVLEAVSIAVPQAEPHLLEAMCDQAVDAVEQCLSSGMLQVVGGGVAFQHELARMAIDASLSPYRRKALHQRALRALTASVAGVPDLARLAHHADGAGDAEAVLSFAPQAARHAASIGAYRESAAQYARALRFGDGLPARHRAHLLEARSYACYLTDQIDASIGTLHKAIELRRAEGDRLGEGAALSTLSRRLGCGARSADAEQAGRQAVFLLEALPPGRELALAYSNLAQVLLNDEKHDETLYWSGRALALAERHGDTAVIVHSLNNIGTIKLLAGQRQGWADLEQSLHLAEQAGLEEHIGRAYLHFGWAMTRSRGYGAAHLFDRGVTRCEDLGLEGWKLHLQAYRARFLLDSGHWDSAADAAAHLLRAAGSVPLLRIFGLTILGLVRARRGDAEVWPPLDEALVMLEGQRELQYLAPVAAARAEAAWLAGAGHSVDGTTRQALATAVQRRAADVVGELAWLRRLTGIAETIPGAGPYSQQLAGEVASAATHWTDRGCGYDAALALVGGADEQALRQALAHFQHLRARPAAAIAARRLRALGVRRMPRGPRRTTTDNPANLTRRQIEVLAQIAQNASNAQIAARLYLSEKTVHHHVTAILRKLDVGTRRQAAAKATLLGITLPEK